MRTLIGLCSVLLVGMGAAAEAQPTGRDQLVLSRQQAGPRPMVEQRSADDWKNFGRYDFDRVEPGRNRYFADRYYRNGRFYRSAALAADARVYRGSDDRLYCRRDDGTTGRIVSGDVSRRLNAGESGLVKDLAVRGRLVCR